MTTDWLLYIGKDDSFKNSFQFNTWGFKSQNPTGKYFKATAKAGDRLWFVKNGLTKLLVAVATFVEFKQRELGPLIPVTRTNEEFGWKSGDWDVEILYSDLYNISDCELHSEIKGQCSIRKYNEKCKINLPLEYPNIVRYSKVTRKV